MKARLFTRVPATLFTHIEEENTALTEFNQPQSTEVSTTKYYDGILVLD